MQTSKTPHTSPRASAPSRRRSRAREAGFTLLEAVIATGVLITGLAAVSNLMIVAVGNNAVGNRASTAVFLASQKMEELRATTFDNLIDSPLNSLNVDQASYNQDDTVDRVGTFHTRWRIQTVSTYGASLKYLSVQTEALGAMSRLTRAEFTTYRSCTTATCLP